MTQIVMTNSFRGGTGKSTIISNLSTYVASFGYKVIIIDADIISPGVHAMFGLGYNTFRKTFTDFLIGNDEIIDAVYDISSNIGLPEDSLMLVPSSIGGSDIAALLQDKRKVERMSKGIKILIKKFNPDYIMIDTHPGLSEDVLVVSDSADIFLNIVRPDNQDYQGLEVTNDVTKKLDLKSYVILNKVHKKLNKTKLINSVSKSYKIPVAGALPLSEEIIIAQSQFIFLDKYPDHKFSLEIQNIASNIFGLKPRKHLELMHYMLKTLKSEGQTDFQTLEKKHGKKVYYYNAIRYLDQLVNKKFIKRTTKDKKELLSITKKGEKFLKNYKTINKFVDNFRL